MGQDRGSDVLDRLGLQKGGYILLSAHREENIDDEGELAALFGAVNALARDTTCPILYSMHPRSRKRIEERGFELHPLVRAHEPMSFTTTTTCR